jgi:3-oxoadipate enol-lactonase
MPVMVHDDLRLFYRDSGTGPPVLFLSGFGSDHSIWNRVIGELEFSYRCISLDSRGYGQSDLPSQCLTIDQMALDTINLLDSLHLSRVHVVGLDMGGMIAQSLARIAPDRLLSMALLGTAAILDGRAEAVLRSVKFILGRMERRECVYAMAPWFLGPGAFQRPEIVETFVGAYTDDSALQTESAFGIQVDCMIAFDSRSYLGEMTIPTAMIAGEYDVFFPASLTKPLTEAIKGAQFVTMPSAGHLVPLEQPLALAEALENLWGRAAGKSPG